MPAKIAINGYGTIGKRVADAVAAQDDMAVAGVVKTKPDFEAKLAVRKGYPMYALNPEAAAKFDKAGLKVSGTLEDLVKAADLVVDCTPEESGYKSLYESAGVKAIWQGGEEHSLTNLSFNAAANYEECLGARFVRVPSCNTTGLIRTLYPLDAHFGIASVLAVMVRRATDPGDSKKGPINAIEPELEMPSHHGPDVQSVLPKLDIHTIAVKVPTTIMHLHIVTADLKKSATVDAVLDVWKRF
ncbi:MAG TPA: type II glyceraldehyde-3-phosphate dehydrogenase, partial [Thermoplasmata archaeon]|nr:type II glyceraldehyde-3-phosphate dehydrogenase [Thermoplasmata archaeon]